MAVSNQFSWRWPYRYNLPIVPDDRYPPDFDPAAAYSRGPVAAALWGAFLGCSWTWVIGMVFPALLLRDHALPGWVVFAVPNVVGAAAMGWVLYRPQRSLTIVRKHGKACHAFTNITVAFHLFVIAWLFSLLFGLAAVPMVVLAIGLCATLGLRNKRSAMLFVAAGLALLSWGAFSYATKMQGAWSLAHWVVPSDQLTRLTTTDLLFFAPCALAGFALCPYLDLTFHRANYSTAPGTGAAAFTFGFGVVFCSMIVFSVCYGAQLLAFIHGEPDAELPGYWLVVLAVHLSLQAGFTITVHVRESIEDPRNKTTWLIAAGGIAVLLGLAARLEALPDHPITGGLTWGEAGYRGFLLLYGTVLPAYVWLMILPRLRGPVSTTGDRAKGVTYVATCVSSYVFGWIAFVQGRFAALLLIVIVFILARIVVELLPRESQGAG